jgi:hypothetical protein
VRERPAHVVYAVKCEVIEFAVGAISRYFLGGEVGVSKLSVADSAIANVPPYAANHLVGRIRPMRVQG